MTEDAVQAERGFPRRRRLTEATCFKRVFAGAIKIGGQYFTVLCLPNGDTEARLGMAVSKRCAPRAVDRNRLKRQVRESFRLEHARLPGVDIVVLAKPAARQADNAQLRKALGRQWQRLSERCASSS
ncbi:ribonuclease P protein component [Alkalilimnicola sp. S0819]|uniref:ribonuclease P protein component n=1 Tax=Alkalilimnicola sp. S0819 TaxID=2613922 RepID=UPI001261E2DD|nr:ribonuclease P protein component [Alkalilimnicola sp. S0819]KAB7624229.1 ribonuclease P protein component [Alkalilimnicola sp. S0819]MPQ16484.1 ribonuclease P protein component [Alkalilimnicola sp. S0819]